MNYRFAPLMLGLLLGAPALAAISVVGTPPTAYTVANNSNVLVPLGGTTASGDLAVGIYGCDAASACSGTTPLSGYTNITSRVGTAQKIYIDYKAAGASESDPTFTRSTGSTNDVFYGGGIILRGVNTSSPVHASTNSAVTKSSGTVATPALTITADNTYVCMALTINGSTTAITAFSSFNPNGTGAWTRHTVKFATATQYANQALWCTLQTTAASVSSSSITVTGGDNGASTRIVMVAFSTAVSAPSYSADPSFNVRTTTSTATNATIAANGATTTRYWVLVVDSSGAPTCAQIKAGQNSSGFAAVYAGSGSITDGVANAATQTGMTSGATLDWYECASNSAGDSPVKALADQRKTPVLSSATLHARTTSSITLRLNGDTPGAIGDCVAVVDGSGVPSGVQVDAGQNSGGGSAYKSGSVSMANASTNYDIALGTYTDGTVRDGYCVIKNAHGDYAAVVAVGDMYKTPIFTVAPSNNSSTTDGFVVGETLDGPGTVDVVVCKYGSTAPNSAEVDALTCAGGTTPLAFATESVTGADTQTLVSMDVPVGDIHLVGSYGGQRSAVSSLLGQTKSPPTGYQYQVLTSISGTSPLISITSPSVAPNDIWEVYAATSPDNFLVVTNSDGNLSYSGTTARQLICHRVYDESAMDWMTIQNPSASCTGTRAALWFNNQVPVFVPLTTSIVLKVGQPMVGQDLCANASDAEGDPLIGSIASGSLPSGLSLSGTGNCTLSGTPTVENESGIDLTFRATDIAGGTGDLALTLYPIDTTTVPDCSSTHLDESACTNLLESSFLLANVSGTECNLALAVGAVISQSPLASSEADPLSVVNLTLSGRDSCGIEDMETYTRYYGSGTTDGDILFTANPAQYDACTLMNTTGSANVFVSLDGNNYSTAPLSLQDMGATTTNPVLSAAALRAYGWRGKFPFIEVRQSGATPASTSLVCWKH